MLHDRRHLTRQPFDKNMTGPALSRDQPFENCLILRIGDGDSEDLPSGQFGGLLNTQDSLNKACSPGRCLASVVPVYRTNPYRASVRTSSFRKPSKTWTGNTFEVIATPRKSLLLGHRPAREIPASGTFAEIVANQRGTQVPRCLPPVGVQRCPANSVRARLRQ